MAAEDAAQPGGGKGSKMLLIVGLVLGLGLGAGGGFFLFGNQAEEGAADEHAAAEPEVPAGPTDPQSHTIERLAVPIYASRGGKMSFLGNYFIDLTIEVDGAENLDKVRAAGPRLQHAFISAISKTDLMRADSPMELDLDKAADVLKERANSVLGNDVVYAVSVSKAVRASR
ncbi:hypothetical protein [Gimibacter soli]|uniref:Flagellar protein FliL n=1 Tax=Gimibacter soli TaxID=3024400 RepID=A0AAE9XUI4_9PROT|nr:hypothetical protein [Gimibacter soli]WCL52989.1 hypothetical protein PH603_10610 [Gimibacter soli]